MTCDPSGAERGAAVVGKVLLKDGAAAVPSTLESLLALSDAVTDSSASRSVRVPFKEPLSREDQLFIEWLSERYIGKSGAPVMCFLGDGVRTLVVPTDLIRKRADESKHPSTERLHQGSENDARS